MDFVNCYEELEKEIRLSGHTFEDIIFAKIEQYIYKKTDKSLCFKLEPDYSIEKLKDFINFCWRINYDRDFGTLKLHGVIVFKDASWLERAEYDGSE